MKVTMPLSWQCCGYPTSWHKGWAKDAEAVVSLRLG